ncbi:MAG: recombination mediator RecR [Anaerolineaceae bacterium]|jgi:recombination protein RecR
MRAIPDPVQFLIDSLSRLPGIGPKTASRLAFFLLKAPDEVSLDLAKALENMKTGTGHCRQCFNITLADEDLCEICASSTRDENVLCVVEEPLDVIAIERTGAYQGKYHVLQGVLSPIEGIGPDQIKVFPLLERLNGSQIKEVIIATNPSLEGDATALFLQQRITPMGIKVSRLARGLPVGGDIEYADQTTLQRALAGRQSMD